IGGRGVQGEPAADVVHVAFDAVDIRITAILNDGQAVFTQEAELETLPALVINRTIPADWSERCLPAQLIVDQEVGSVAKQARLTIDSARTEALGPGSIEHQPVARLVGGVEAIRE